MDTVNKVFKVADSYLSVLHRNKLVSSVIMLLLILYAGLAAPALPASVAALFDNEIFKVAVLFFLLAVRNYNPTVALLVAVGFVLSMQTLSKYHVFTMAHAVTAPLKTRGKKDRQPVQHDPVLPPEENMDLEVSARLNPTNDAHSGPQGMQAPTGYDGNDLATIGLPDSEL